MSSRCFFLQAYLFFLLFLLYKNNNSFTFLLTVKTAKVVVDSEFIISYLVENNMSGDNGQWFWNSSTNPFDKTSSAIWTAYNPQDNTIIEKAFQQKANKAELESHIIHFNERMQVHKQDFNRQRPIKREKK